jgi:hypothetical protein
MAHALASGSQCAVMPQAVIHKFTLCELPNDKGHATGDCYAMLGKR